MTNPIKSPKQTSPQKKILIPGTILQLVVITPRLQGQKKTLVEKTHRLKQQGKEAGVSRLLPAASDEGHQASQSTTQFRNLIYDKHSQSCFSSLCKFW